MVHHNRPLDRSAVAMSCLLSWLGQALSVGLDRAPILPRTSAALARPRSAPALEPARLRLLLALARREFDRTSPPPSFPWSDFERLARRRFGPRVLRLRPQASRTVDIGEGLAPGAAHESNPT
jgi:hypothetical protein